MHGILYHLRVIGNFLPKPQPYKVCGRNPVLAMVNSKSGDNQVRKCTNIMYCVILSNV